MTTANKFPVSETSRDMHISAWGKEITIRARRQETGGNNNNMDFHYNP